MQTPNIPQPPIHYWTPPPQLERPSCNEGAAPCSLDDESNHPSVPGVGTPVDMYPGIYCDNH